VVGDEARVASTAALRDAFRTDLVASIDRVMETRAIDYIPASVELADFDPTATAIAVTIAGLASVLPHDALERTFERYWKPSRRGSAGRAPTTATVRTSSAMSRFWCASDNASALTRS